MAKGKGFQRLVSLIFDRDAAQRMEEETAASLGRAGEQGSEELAKALELGGRTATRALTKALTDEYNKTITAARVQLGKGLIDQAEFDRIRREADRTFNAGLIPQMERLRAEGKITEQEFQVLARRIKRVGEEGAKDFGLLERGLQKAKTIAAGLLALFAVDRIRSFVQGAIGEFLQAEESLLRLNAMIAANGGAVERTGAQLVAFSKELQRETLFQAQEIELDMSQLFSYHSISGDTYERTIRLATDLSSVFGGLTSSTEALARALDDPIAGLGQLRKQGFTFEESVISQVRALAEQNRLLEAQAILLTALEGEVGGVAKSMKTGLTGALDDLNKVWGDLRENIGQAIVTMGNGEAGARRLASVVRTVAENADELVALVVNLGKAIIYVGSAYVLGRFTLALRTATAAAVAARSALVGMNLLLGPWGLLAVGVTTLTTIFQAFGAAARKAAREAKEAASEFEESLATMDRATVQAQLSQQRNALADTKSRIAVLRIEREEMDKSAKLGNSYAASRVQQIDRELKGLTQQEAVLKNQVALLQERRTELLRPADPDEGGAAAVEYLTREISQLRQLKDLRALTADESARLTEAEQRLRNAIASGTLTVEEEIAARQALKVEKKDAAKELSAEIALLAKAAKLNVLTAEGWGRALDIAANLRKELEKKNLSMERTVELREQLQALESVPGVSWGLPEVATRGQVLELDLEFRPTDTSRQEWLDHWLSEQERIRHAVEDAAWGSVRAWEDAFGRIMEDGATVGDFMDVLGRSMSAAMLGGMATFAQGKAQEHAAAAIGAVAYALGFSSLGNFKSSGEAWASAAEHTAASAAWGILGGGAGASAGAVRGGGGGRGITSPRDAGLHIAQKAEAAPINIYVDPFNPANPIHAKRIGQGMELNVRLGGRPDWSR